MTSLTSPRGASPFSPSHGDEINKSSCQAPIVRHGNKKRRRGTARLQGETKVDVSEPCLFFLIMMAGKGGAARKAEKREELTN